MFAFLAAESDGEDVDGAHAGAAAAEAPAAPEEAVAPSARRLLLEKGKHAKMVKDLQACIGRLLGETNPSVAEAVSTRVFGLESAGVTTHSERSWESVSPSGASLRVEVNHRAENVSLNARGLASHIGAVSRALRDRLQSATRLVHSEVQDDASMTVQRPSDSKDLRELEAIRAKIRRRREEATTAEGKRKALKGNGGVSRRNVHLQALNMLQHCHVTGPTGVTFFNVHAPTQALPIANIATIYKRKAQWSVMCGGACGEMFRHED